MMQPQDFFPQMGEASKHAKINQIIEAYEQETASTKKTLKRAKQIKIELVEITEIYQKNVLQKTDELEQLGLLEAARSKDFSNLILKLSNLVPPIELEASINNLETQIKQKLAEMDHKIKNLKSKKKKKSEKKTLEQRMALLSDERK